MITAVLLDVDGTLILSNDAHAHSWVDAFAEYGYEIRFDDVRKLIGMGGDKLITTLNADLTEESGDGKKIKELRTQIFLDDYSDHLLPTPGCRSFVKMLLDTGLKVIVASSASQQELDVLLKKAGIDDLIEQTTTSDDAEKSKPEPDIVGVALERIEVDASVAVMIGDTPYDIEAAARAGVRCIAVRSGGWSDQELSDSVAIYEDTDSLTENWQSIVKYH